MPLDGRGGKAQIRALVIKQRPPQPLTGKQRRHLRALGHNLSAVVQVGHQGITEGIIGAIDEALDLHELVKVKVGNNAPELDAPEDNLVKQLGCHVAQVIGHTLLLYRQAAEPEDRRIVLPKASSPAPAPSAD